MKILKITLLVLAIAFIANQFYRPEKNTSAEPAVNNISAKFAVPAEVDKVLRTSCYDCHSNNTKYPWYAEVQPLGWWLADHVEHGTEELNFDEFSSYRPRRQYRKFQEIDEQLSKEEMPLPSYLIVHRDAVLSPDQKTLLISWSNAMRDSMKAEYPIDSLERKQAR